MLRTRPAAEQGTTRVGRWSGATWSACIAVSYFFISSPLVFEPDFDDSLRRAFLCTALACVLTLMRLRTPRVPWAALPFLGFCLVSSLWSINSDDTINFLGLYVVLTVLGVVTAGNVGTRALSHGIMGGAVIVTVASVYAYWQELPGAQVATGSSGYLAGVGMNRNILAYSMILAFAFAASFLPRAGWRRVGWGSAVVVILAGILLAESATGIVAVCIVTAVAFVLGLRDAMAGRGRVPGRRFLTIVAALVLSLAVLALAWYTALGRDIQRDLSLTGRSAIWDAVWATSGTETRLLGEGWGAVWQHPWRRATPNGQFDAIIEHLGYYVPHGHNSVMGLVPEVGLIGVALFGLLYAWPLLRARRQRRHGSTSGREAGRVAILGVLALVLAGVTEPMSTVPLAFYVTVLLIAHAPSEPPAATPAPAPVVPHRQ